MISVRRAVETDSADLLRWRNDPVSRAASMSTQQISATSHDAWFRRTLADPHRYLYIGLTDGQTPFGMVRFDSADGTVEVSVNLAPTHRGKGLARGLVQAAIERFTTDAGYSGVIRARVRSENEASMRLFRSLGFRRVDSGAEPAEFALISPGAPS